MNPIVTERTNKTNVIAYVQGNKDGYEMGETESIAICKLLIRLQGKMIRTWSGAFILATFAWLSVFVEMWRMLNGLLQSSPMAWAFLVFFFLVALFSSSLAMRK
jgi:hypothetical protein